MSVVSSGQLAWDSGAWEERRRRSETIFGFKILCLWRLISSDRANKLIVNLYHASCIALIKLQILMVLCLGPNEAPAAGSGLLLLPEK